jgi:hypothetical protein
MWKEYQSQLQIVREECIDMCLNYRNNSTTKVIDQSSTIFCLFVMVCFLFVCGGGSSSLND